MTRPSRAALFCVGMALGCLPACQNTIWLSDDVDAHTDPDAGTPQLDANDRDASTVDVDAGPVGRACERVPVTITVVGVGAPLEDPTFAASGRRETLRYGVLVPPSASLTSTADTHLILVDAEANVVHDRAIRLQDASGAPTSSATLHSLSAATDDEGFLVLAPAAIWMLDRDGAGASATAVLATPPSSAWQRAAGWLDADRFAFVSDTPDLLVAVFDRRTAEVTTTTISVAHAATVHVEPGGITTSATGPGSEVVVYDPDLTGVEALRLTWADGSPLEQRLLGVGSFGGERTWLVRDPSEFRTNITAYAISPAGALSPGVTQALLGPLTTTNEGPFVAIESENPALVLYGLETHAFSSLATDFGGTTLVEHERDGTRVAILFLTPASGGRRSLDLACGRR